MYTSPPMLDRAIRSGGYNQTLTVQARRGQTPIYEKLPVVLDAPNTVTDKAGDGVRRTLNLTVNGETGLFDALAPNGTTLHVYSHFDLGGGITFTIPMGVYDADIEEQGLEPGATLSLTCPDKWSRIQRARFITPQQASAGQPVTEQIAQLVRGALGSAEPVFNYSRGLWTVTPLVWEKDRDKAIADLATSVGVYVSFNRIGQCEIRDIPQLGDTSVWTVDSSPVGVLSGGSRRSARTSTYNVVIVSAESAGQFGPPFQPVIVWDSDPDSPTYAGPDPVNRPDLAGPFGIAPYAYSTAAITDSYAALQAANAILAKVTGLAKTTSVEVARHPCLDAYDPITLLPPRPSPTAGIAAERHVIDQITHPLGPTGTQAIQGRSTRTDPYT